MNTLQLIKARTVRTQAIETAERRWHVRFATKAIPITCTPVEPRPKSWLSRVPYEAIDQQQIERWTGTAPGGQLRRV